MSVDHSLARPRVEGDREQEILHAVMAVLEEVGYDRLTFDAVATRARASKATLYRRWSDKVNLVVDALRAAHAEHHVDPPDTGSLREDLIGTYCGQGGMSDKHSLAAFGAVVTAVLRDAEFAAAFRRDVIGPKAAATREVFERARRRGEIGDHIDLDLLTPVLAGVVLHRVFMLGELPTDDLVTRVVDEVVVPALTRPAPTPPGA